LFIVPWSDTPRAQLTMSMYGADGQPFFADPRHLLSRIIDRFSAEHRRPDVAIELEFYFCSMNRGRPRAPVWPGRDLPDKATQCYGLEQLDDCGEFIDAILAAAQQQDIAAESAISEYAPGQYEINLDHTTDPLRVCDDAVRLKRIVKGVADRQGLQATFMAKPYPELAGNGQHIHASVLGRDGDNLFSGEAERPNPALSRAIAGLQAACGDFMAIFAPNANSYRRFVPGNYAPTSNCWGINNRTVALRVPLGDRANRRIEHRVAGADANPYLVMAAVLAGLHYGLNEERLPEPPVTGNAYDVCRPNLPDTWIGGLYAFQESGLAETYFGSDYCRLFTSLKLAEREKFNREVTDLEYEWYLRTV
jgi:glutamine synthetase